MKVNKKVLELLFFLVFGIVSALATLYVYRLVNRPEQEKNTNIVYIKDPNYKHRPTVKLAEAEDKDPISAFSFRNAVAKVSASIVNVYSQSKINNQTINTYGSGIVMSEDGYVLTNYHVVAGVQKIAIGTNNNVWTADLVGFDKLTDLAVLKIQATDYSNIYPIQIPKAQPTLSVGDIVLALGNPLNIGQSVTLGIISGLGRKVSSDVNFEQLIQTDVALNTGNSGGALININGDVIGINSLVVKEAYGTQVSGLGFAVPIMSAVRIMRQIIKYGHANHIYIGADIKTIVDNNTMRQAVVNMVTPGSPAFKSGLQVGDYIVSVNGIVPADLDNVFASLENTQPGDKVEIQVNRNGQYLTLPLTLGSYQEFVKENKANVRFSGEEISPLMGTQNTPQFSKSRNHN